MKKLLFLSLLCVGCSYDLPEVSYVSEAEKVLEISIDPSHTWCTTEKGSVMVRIPGSYNKAQIVVKLMDEEGEPVYQVLTETDKDGVLYYDYPKDNHGVDLLYSDSKGNYAVREIVKTRSEVYDGIQTSSLSTPTIISIKDSYSKKRGWNNVILYDTDLIPVEVQDYAPEFSSLMKTIIFSYLRNGRQYNNLEKIKESGIYNENSYPITTGKDPIIVSPVYKNDGTSQEVENCELYYYYYPGDLENPDLESLPKYRAIVLRNSIRDNDVLEKFHSYVLAYWGDSIPVVGQEGSYVFPEGYKIGFMLRSNVSSVKQGELYCDGRLNSKINSWGHFKSSGLAEDDPRAAWMTVNEKNLLCFESGTDKDFNDLVLEISGGIKAPIVIPEIDHGYYTFCFEDSRVGDYDLNDVVLMGRRLDKSHVEYSLLACGAYDNLFLCGVNGETLNNEKEIHAIFGVPEKTFINTQAYNVPEVKDTIEVPESFSFLNPDTQPYIWNDTKKYNIHIARTGEDPHAIMIPSKFAWSKEKICIKDSYLEFGNWGENQVESTGWYLSPVEEKVIRHD